MFPKDSAEYAGRIFISYASEDREKAHRLCNDLKLAGFGPWLDRDDLLSGQNWMREIRRAIKGCDQVILLISKHSVSRPGFIQEEIRMALEELDEKPPRSIYLIQARLEDCWSDHERLNELQWVDMFPDWEQGVKKIVAAIEESGGRKASNGEIRGESERFFKDVSEIFDLKGCKISDFPGHPGWFLALRKDAFLGRETRMLVHPRILYDTADDVQIVNEFLSKAKKAIETKQVSCGFLVANRRLTAESLGEFYGQNVLAKTYDELLENLIDFGKYFENFVREMEREDSHCLLETYVELDFSRMDLERISRFLKKSRDDVRGGLPSTEFLSNGILHSHLQEFPENPGNTADLEIDPDSRYWIRAEKSIDAYAASWLHEENAPHHISILGDFGAGKTSFSKHFTYDLIKRRLKGDGMYSSRIPLYIPLHVYDRIGGATGVGTLLTDCLAENYDVDVSRRALKKLMEAGKLLLILDGFDEMYQKVDAKTRKDNFRFLSELAQPPNKVILTGRPGYFPSFSEIVEIFSRECSSDDLLESLIGHIRERDTGKKVPVFEILKLELFSEEQLDSFLDLQIARLKKEGTEISEAFKPFVKERKRLLDLFGRPVLVWMMVEALPKLISKGKDVSALTIAELYQVFTRNWLHRDEDKGPVRGLKTSEERMKFAMDLAWELHLKGQREISVRDLEERVKVWFQIDDALEASYVTHDVRLCTFLSHDERDGYFKFVHKSFQEYFVAVRLAEWLKKGKIDRIISQEEHSTIGTTGDGANVIHINEAIRSFVYDLLYGKWTPIPFTGDLPDGLIYQKNKIVSEMDGAEMVYVPPGPFIMGEGGRRVVDLDFGFFIDKFPVTNRTYRRFIDAGGYRKREYWSKDGWNFREKEKITEPGYWRNDRFNQSDYPVVGISWFEAEAFGRWAGKQLPTESMWEKAARGIDGRRYPWGDFEPDSLLCNFDGERDNEGPSPVSKYEKGKSPLGLYDMEGNVWEWCSDMCSVPNERSEVWRPFRGGCWFIKPSYVYCAYRDTYSPNFRIDFLGFRLARRI